jgi:hypothetical protein
LMNRAWPRFSHRCPLAPGAQDVALYVAVHPLLSCYSCTRALGGTCHKCIA